MKPPTSRNLVWFRVDLQVESEIEEPATLLFSCASRRHTTRPCFCLNTHLLNRLQYLFIFINNLHVYFEIRNILVFYTMNVPKWNNNEGVMFTKLRNSLGFEEKPFLQQERKGEVFHNLVQELNRHRLQVVTRICTRMKRGRIIFMSTIPVKPNHYTRCI